MAFITLGAATELVIKVPTIGTTDWGDTMRTDTFLKIAEHNHDGSGNGAKLGAGSFENDSVTNLNIRLANDGYLRARNFLNTADINILKIDTSDDLFIDAQISKVLLKNNVYLTGRNNADSASVDVLKIDTSDRIIVKTDRIESNPSITLADNQAATTAGIVTLGTDESCTVHYRIVRNGVTQSGTLKFTDVDTVPAEEYSGTLVGVTFTVNAGDLEYATTSTGQTGSMTYVVIKE